MTGHNQKIPRDWWDKAHIISGFLSSVVIAIVGIYITYSIQQAQISSSAAQAEAQKAQATEKPESKSKKGKKKEKVVDAKVVDEDKDKK